MVIDRGSDHGLRPGQRLTLFRPGVNGRGPIIKIGDAVVASTQHETSVMRIGQTTGEVQLGDLIAVHRWETFGQLPTTNLQPPTPGDLPLLFFRV